MFDINPTYNFILQCVCTFIEAFLCVYLWMKLLKTNKIQIGLIVIFITIEMLCINNDYKIFVILLTMSIYMYFIMKVKSLYAILLPLISITIYMTCICIEKLLTPYSILAYADIYETIVLHLIFLFIINKVVDLGKERLNIRHIFNFMITQVSVIFLLSFFVKLMIHQEYSYIELITLGFCIIMISILSLYYIYIYNQQINYQIDLSHDLKNEKYLKLNHIEMENKYHINNKLNHNMKYILMNIKLYLQQDNNHLAREYIDDYLNEMASNKICYTGNAHFDYMINKYNESLKKKNINVEKEIFISQESYLNNDKYIDEIKKFLEKQYQYLHILETNSYHLSIYEKGDFTIVKAIYDIDDEEKIKGLKNQFEIDDHIIIVKQIIYK